MMVNNSTNINKTNNHLSPEHTKKRGITTYDIGNPDPGLGHTQKCGGVKPSPLDNWISNGNAFIKTIDRNSCTDSLEKNTYYNNYKCQHKHEQYNR